MLIHFLFIVFMANARRHHMRAMSHLRSHSKETTHERNFRLHLSKKDSQEDAESEFKNV